MPSTRSRSIIAPVRLPSARRASSSPCPRLTVRPRSTHAVTRSTGSKPSRRYGRKSITRTAPYGSTTVRDVNDVPAAGGAGRLARRIFLKEGHLRPVLRVIVFALAFLIAFVVIGATMAGLSGGSPTDLRNLDYRWTLELECGMTLAVVAAALPLRRFLDGRSIASLGLAVRRSWLRLFATGAIIGIGMQSLVFVMERALGYSRITAVAPLASDVHELALYIPLFIAVAVSEELLVRGYIFQNLWEEFGLPAAAIISALIFASLHLSNPGSHANVVLTVTGLAAYGVWACLSVAWTRSLWLAVGVHFAWNLFEGPVFGFPVSGLDFGASAISQRFSGPAWLTGGAFG